MCHSCPARGRCYPADPKSRVAHVCNDPHIPCKIRNASRTHGKSEYSPTQRTQDAIYQPCEWRTLEKQKSDTFKENEGVDIMAENKVIILSKQNQ